MSVFRMNDQGEPVVDEPDALDPWAESSTLLERLILGVCVVCAVGVLALAVLVVGGWGA